MIHDAKGGPFTAVLNWYIRRKVRSAFRGVWVRGELPSADGGLLAYVNHSSFWDGFIVQQLGQVARWNAHAMMEEANLAKYRFHTRIGAFSVRRDPKGAMESIRYTKKVLARPNAAVFVFPEGEIRAGHGPLGPLMRGVDVIARAADVRCVPIAVRYAFLEHEYPDVLIEVGAPHPAEGIEGFAARLSAVYAQVLSARSTEGFTRVIAGRSSVQERWDQARRAPPGSTHREDVASPSRT
jgi:1-acyl-sn-glycerol-3-phosphate acyltransferase